MTHQQLFAGSADVRVSLTNARFADVISGKYFPAGTSLILQNGKIAAMPGAQGEKARHWMSRLPMW